jgi:hypothetical protein
MRYARHGRHGQRIGAGLRRRRGSRVDAAQRHQHAAGAAQPRARSVPGGKIGESGGGPDTSEKSGPGGSNRAPGPRSNRYAAQSGGRRWQSFAWTRVRRSSSTRGVDRLGETILRNLDPPATRGCRDRPRRCLARSAGTSLDGDGARRRGRAAATPANALAASRRRRCSPALSRSSTATAAKTVPQVCRMAGLPYVGSGVAGWRSSGQGDRGRCSVFGAAGGALGGWCTA